jgi:hypothetical protein
MVLQKMAGNTNGKLVSCGCTFNSYEEQEKRGSRRVCVKQRKRGKKGERGEER